MLDKDEEKKLDEMLGKISGLKATKDGLKYTLNLDQVSYSDVIAAGIDMFELHSERFVLIPSERELTPEEEDAHRALIKLMRDSSRW